MCRLRSVHEFVNQLFDFLEMLVKRSNVLIVHIALVWLLILGFRALLGTHP